MKIIKSIKVLMISITVLICSNVHADVLSNIGYIPDKVNFMMYSNINNLYSFASSNNISKYDLPYILGDLNYKRVEDTLGKFGLKVYDIKEVLSTANTDLVNKKDGTLVVLYTDKKNIKVPDMLTKVPGNDKLYLVDKRSKLYMSIDKSIIVLGHQGYVNEFLKNRKDKIAKTSKFKEVFLRQCKGKTYYLSLEVSSYLKSKMDSAVKRGVRLGKGLDSNIFIKTLLNVESLQAGISTNGGMNFSAGVQGSKVGDAKNLLMVSHFFIVGSSFAVTFADMYAKKQYQRRHKGKELKPDKNMEIIQKFFSRVDTKIVNNGVNISLDLEDREIDAIAAKLKDRIEKEKEVRIARLEKKLIDEFIMAINKNDKPKIAEFLNRNINVNGKGMFGATLLNTASKKGDLMLVKELIKKGADVNLRGRRGYTPIQNAVIANKLNVVKLLVNQKSSLTVKTWNRSSLLHLAVVTRNLKMVEYLSGKGISVEERDYNGRRPIDIASKIKAEKIVSFFKTRYKQKVKK